MAFSSDDAPKAPAVVERFVKQLVVTMKAVMLYPSASSIPKENAAETVKILREILQGRSDMRFAVTKQTVFYESIPVFPGQQAFESFARELYNRGLAEVRFHAGTESADVTRFLEILKHSPAEIAEVGGFEARLWEQGVDSITVVEASIKVVDDDGEHPAAEQLPGEDWPPTPSRIEELLAGAYGGRPRDQRLLVRVIGDPKAVSAYLKETLSGRGETSGEGGAGTRFAELARAISGQPSQSRPDLYRSLADAVSMLDAEERREFIAERLLPDARKDESLAAVVRQMDIDEVCKLLVEGLTDDEASVEGLARAMRNLAMISLAERDEVLNAAGVAMREAGLGEGVVGQVLEGAAPSHLTIKGESGEDATDEESPTDSVLKMLDLAPTAVADRFNDDSEFIALQEESRKGVTDGDVVRTLTGVVSVDANGSSFATVMSLLEDNLELLLERNEYEVAADVAASLRIAMDSEDLSDNRRKRIEASLRKLMSVEQMREISKAMRMYRRGTSEYESCKRLLETLGHEAIDPLLELLADEPDMTARKALVDLISEMAGAFIEELASRASDSRWYVVRNVVAILGKTHDPSILPTLGRTLRHGDPRVRRETIRALSTVPDKLADELLVSALSDADAQNVQLAARYLGTARSKGAASALQQLAQGEGRGNRDTAPRVEAIEALGRIGDPATVPVLEQIAGKRRLIGSRSRELRSSAEAAIIAIKRSDSQRGGEPS